MPIPGLSAVPFFSAGRAGVTATLTDSVADSTSASSYSFASRSFGPSSSTKTIVVLFGWTGTGTARTISSATIGGVSASLTTVSTSSYDGSSPDFSVQFGIATVSAASGTVAATMSGGCARMGIAIVALEGLLSTTPTATLNVNSDNPAGAISVSGDGIVLGGCIYSSGLSTSSWTGIDKLWEFTVEVPRLRGGFKTFSSSQLLSVAVSTGSGQGTTASWIAMR